MHAVTVLDGGPSVCPCGSFIEHVTCIQYTCLHRLHSSIVGARCLGGRRTDIKNDDDCYSGHDY